MSVELICGFYWRKDWEFSKEQVIEWFRKQKEKNKPEIETPNNDISDVIGSYYNKGGLEGIVVAVDKDEKPTLIMSMTMPEKEMTWNEAMKWRKQLPSPWHLPTKEELEQIWIVKGHPNQITKMINNGCRKYGAFQLPDDFLWSSSEYDRYNAWNVSVYFGNVDSFSKSFRLCVRAVASVSFDF